jgi:hypothetical protein
MTTASDINDRISALPKEALNELEKYIDFLAYKHGDWSLELSDEQSNSVNRGLNDIESESTFTHFQVQEKMKNYLRKSL